MLIFNQPPRLTQPGHPSRWENWVVLHQSCICDTSALENGDQHHAMPSCGSGKTFNYYLQSSHYFSFFLVWVSITATSTAF